MLRRSIFFIYAIVYVLANHYIVHTYTLTTSSWQPNIQAQTALAKKRIEWIYREQDIAPYTLPDPLRCENGTLVTTVEQWVSQRREELIHLFAKNIYGYPAEKPRKIHVEVRESNPSFLNGNASYKQVSITTMHAKGETFSFEASLYIPYTSTAIVPVLIFINNRSVSSTDTETEYDGSFLPIKDIMRRGYALAMFKTNEVEPDHKNDSVRSRGVRNKISAPTGKRTQEAWATISAWAWGAQRVLDWLETEPRIDIKKVGVIGHSRGGKAALWAGAQDTRFGLVIANCSGRGGASLSRRRFGETVAAINTKYPHWFCQNFKRYNNQEDELPIDQHQLLSLIAPRALALGEADADFWSDQRGSFLSLAYAGPVYRLYGYDPITEQEMPPLEKPLFKQQTSFHIRSGKHDLTAYDWQTYLNFADTIFRLRK